MQTVSDRDHVRAASANHLRVAIGLLILLPILVKVPMLLGLVNRDIAGVCAGLAVETGRGYVFGRYSIDPNICFTSHALGTLSARLFASGQPLWWNHYEGVGAPLAGEMQSAALFPLTWLMIWPKGQVIEHILFQIIAGIGTFAFLRQRGTSVLAAWTGGTLYAFNGVFAWLGNAVVNPIFFLPLLMLGVERQFSERRGDLVSGGGLIALAVAGSLYAGFPETAYLDGLLVAVWTIYRLVVSTQRVAPLVRIGFFALCGVLIAAPILVSFGDFFIQSYVGLHATESLHQFHQNLPEAIAQFGIPYFLGTIFEKHELFWDNIGGFAGIGISSLAMLGAVGKTDRGGRVVLSAWVIFCIGVMYGSTLCQWVMSMVPFASSIMVTRYLPPSWLFCLALLAAFATDDLRAARTTRRTAIIAIGVAGAMVFMLATTAYLSGLRPTGALAMRSIVGAVAVWATIMVTMVAPLGSPRRKAAIIAAAITVEQMLLFVMPVLSAPRSMTIADGGVRFLQNNIGMQRFVTLGPIDPNYGSFYNLSQVNHNDLPVSRLGVDYIHRHLDAHADPIIFSPTRDTLLGHLTGYQAIGTRYVLTNPKQSPLNLPLAYQDRAMRIYALTPRAYFTAPGCIVEAHDRTSARLNCAASTRLLRLEQFMTGWGATLNDKPTPIGQADGLFQSVAVPAGRTVVTFQFLPSHIMWAQGLLAIGLVACALGLAITFRSRSQAIAAVVVRSQQPLGSPA